MSVTMRIIQQYDPAHEKEFLELERKFVELEASRPDYPNGRRMKPISSSEPCHTLIWECCFPDISAARAALDFFEGDPGHEQLFRRQVQFFKSARVEFYENLEW